VTTRHTVSREVVKVEQEKEEFCKTECRKSQSTSKMKKALFMNGEKKRGTSVNGNFRIGE
jgi:hypothetical protein